MSELREAVDALAAALAVPHKKQEARRLALSAAGRATALLDGHRDLETSVVVGQVRSTAVDLLRAAGVERLKAEQAVDEAQDPETSGTSPVRPVAGPSQP